MLQHVLSRTNSVPPSMAGLQAPDDGLAPLEALATTVHVARDQALFWEDDEALFSFKVVSGAVRVCKQMADGRRQVTDFFLPGDLISFDLGGVHSCTAEAIVDTIVRRYPKPHVERLFQDDPRAARRLLALASGRLALAQMQFVTLGRMTALERVAHFLTELADRASSRDQASRKVRVPMNRVDIADYLGLTVETVSRTFSRLKRDGVIDLPDAHSVVIRDRDALDALSDGGES